jgi:hypothetical protein
VVPPNHSACPRGARHEVWAGSNRSNWPQTQEDVRSSGRIGRPRRAQTRKARGRRVHRGDARVACAVREVAVVVLLVTDARVPARGRGARTTQRRGVAISERGYAAVRNMGRRLRICAASRNRDPSGTDLMRSQWSAGSLADANRLATERSRIWRQRRHAGSNLGGLWILLTVARSVLRGRPRRRHHCVLPSGATRWRLPPVLHVCLVGS